MDDSAIAEGTSVPAEKEPAVVEAQPKPETAEAQPESKEEGVTSDVTEPSGDENTEKEGKPKRNPFQERISELTGKVKAKEAEAQAAIERAEALERMLGEAKPRSEIRPPTLEECGYDEQVFTQRLTDYHMELNQSALSDQRKREQQFERRRAQEELNRAVSERFMAKAAEFSQDHPDYQTRITNPAFVQAEHVAHAIRMSDNGPALAYHLAGNPALTDTLNRSNPIHALMELGRISAQLSAPRPVATTQTPAPAAPVKASGIPQKDPDKMTAKEYQQWRNKQLGFS